MKKTKAQILAFFSEKKLISQATATAITDSLYEKGLDIKSLERVMWRVEEYVRREKMATIFDLLTIQEIGQIIDEMIAEDNEWKTKGLQNECGSSKLSQPAANFTAWGFSEFAEGDKTAKKAGDIVDIQIMRTGKWNHPAYGEFEVTTTTLEEVKANFNNNLRGIKLAVDENHEPNHKALAWYIELYQVTTEDLFAKLELTQKGADLLNEGAYKYFSPEIVFYKIDEETGKPITNMLVGWAFTNRPFFKSMQPLMASEDGGATTGKTAAQGVAGSEHSQNFYIFFDPPMKTLLDLLAQFSELAKINLQQKKALESAFGELSEDSRSTQITAAYNEAIAKFSDEPPAEDPVNPPAAEVTPPAEEKKIEASETKMVSISASELDALRVAATKAKESEASSFSEFIGQAFAGCVFSEDNKTSVVLPKHKDKIQAFATAIGMERAKEFFEILGELKSFSTQEIGTGSEPEKKPETSEKYSEAVKFYQETMGFSEDEAKAAALELTK